MRSVLVFYFKELTAVLECLAGPDWRSVKHGYVVARAVHVTHNVSWSHLTVMPFGAWLHSLSDHALSIPLSRFGVPAPEQEWDRDYRQHALSTHIVV